MDARRFFDVSYDSRNNPKVRMLRLMGDGIAEYGRYVALLAILYDTDNRVFVGAGEEGALGRAYLASELDLPDDAALMDWIGKAAACGLVSGRALKEFEAVMSSAVGEQLEFRRHKSESGKRGGRPRKQAAKTPPAAGQDGGSTP